MGLYKAIRGSAGDRSERAFVALLILIVTLLMLTGDAGRELLRYDRSGIAAGEWWRLVSAHLVHLGWSHFALNSVGLILVWTLVGNVYSAPQWLLVALVAVATMAAGFWFLNPDLAWYVGLSGLLHALLVAGIVARLSRKSPQNIFLTVLLIAKLAWEQFSGPLPGSEAAATGVVIVDAHLYGAAGGVVGGLLNRIRVRPRASI